MTKKLKEFLERAETWPEEDQAELAEYVRDIEARRTARVAFVMTHGIPVPGWRHVGRMRLVQAHMAEFMIPQVKENDLVRLLQHLHAGLEKNVGYPRGPTPVAWGWVGHASQREVQYDINVGIGKEIIQVPEKIDV